MTDSIVLRGGTVLTMDDSHTIHAAGDVLVVGDRVEAVGPDLDVPDGTREIDASGGIHARVSSPTGASTLITSAPRSANSIVE